MVDQATGINGIDVANNPAECSNMDIFDRSIGQCFYQDGFEGNACERQSCQSTCNNFNQCIIMH